jgi:predicted dehydrogenase
MGPLRHFAAEFGYPITAQSNPVCFAAQGGGVLLDRMIYLVTIARLAAGPVSEVQARITRDRNGIDTHAALLLSHGGGAKSQLTASFSALLGNAAALGFAEGAIVIEEPLLAAEQLRVTPMSPATSRVEGSGSGLKAKLKAQPLFRKAVAFRKRQQATHLSYGSSSYAPELQHFIDLVKRGEKASPILPPSLTLEVHHVLATARAKDAVA